MSGSLPILTANATFDAAFVETRDLSYFMYSALVPLVVLLGLLLLTPLRGSTLGALSLVAGLVALAALLKLLHDLVYDIAGYPDYKMPVWTVLYSILYIVEGFTFLFFGLSLMEHKGIDAEKEFVDCLYLSLARTFGMPPEPSFLPVLQSGLMMFLNIVIITKFVTAF